MGEEFGNLGFRDDNCFLDIAGQEALIQALLGRQYGIGAEENAEELQLRDIAAHDNQADGQRGGEKQPDRSPQGRPEHCSKDDGKG